MGKLKLTLDNGKTVLVEKGSIINDIFIENEINFKNTVTLANLNNKLYELTSPIEEEGVLKGVDIRDKNAMKAYVRTLQFILIKAALELYPDIENITLEHSLSKGIFGEIHKANGLDVEDINSIKKRMQEIIQADYPIKKVTLSKAEAIKIFEGYNMQDKVRLLKYFTTETVKLYELNGFYDYFYGPMAFSTGAIKLFDLIYHEPGFNLRYPDESKIDELPPFVDFKKLSKIFYETEQWGNILGVGDVGSLNEKVENKEIIDIIRVSEALHEKKIANIADMICDRDEVKIVLIAGPSSSGKTTFSKRLGIQLRVNGLIPVPISLDDYFVEREFTPKDENGEYDFESIYALDLELFNRHLNLLLQGEAVELPVFNFKTGKREWSNVEMKLPKNGIIIIEGIHGLNDILTSTIPSENKFKIYISALTQLNLDDHNRIATTSIRILRRIVRDFLSRGYGSEKTLLMWPSVRRGEEKNIFIYQESADAMFNSSLVYELCVLKKFALEELNKIDSSSPAYCDAVNLKSFLKYFKEVETNLIPENSILREFIGGSCFYKY